MQEVYYISVRKYLDDGRVESSRFELQENAMAGNPDLVIMVYNGEPTVIYSKR